MHVEIRDCMVPPDSFFGEWRAELPRALLQVQSVCPKDVQDYGAQARISRHRCARGGRLRALKLTSIAGTGVGKLVVFVAVRKRPICSSGMGYHKFATI